MDTLAEPDGMNLPFLSYSELVVETGPLSLTPGGRKEEGKEWEKMILATAKDS